MKKLLLLAVLAAALIPATAGAVVFSDISGIQNMTVVTKGIVDNLLITDSIKLVNGANHGVATGVPGQDNLLFFEDHFTFTGADNDALLTVKGNILPTLRINRFVGPASFTLKIPAIAPVSGTQVIITGATKVRVIARRRRVVTKMVFEPASVVFNSFSGGVAGLTRDGDAVIRVPAAVKKFRNISSDTLPPGFGNGSM